MNNLTSKHSKLNNKESCIEKKIVISSNYAWTILNFRLPLIRKLKSIGYKVIIITQFDGFEGELKSEVDDMIPLYISRKGVNPFVDFLTFINFVRSLQMLKPHCLLLFTIKPVIYGSVAAKLCNIKSIATITGLGTSFISKNWITSLVKKLYRFALSASSTVFFQNSDDKNVFLNNKLVNPEICKLIPGSGIDLDQFSLSRMEENSRFTFLLIARMIWDKGIGDFVEAAKLIISKYPNTKFHLLGPLGVLNRTSISRRTMSEWEEDGFIEYLGESSNVIPNIEEASCIVLPSYREGTSRVLLEAAAIGRPVIATDVPGCREVVRNNINGLLCRPKDHHDLSNKMEIMINLPFKDRKKMGIRGREIVENEFNQEIVNDLYTFAIEN